MIKNKTLLIMIAVVAIISGILVVVLIFNNTGITNESTGDIVSKQQDKFGSESNKVISEDPEWGSGETYDGTAPIIRKMGEVLSVTGITHRKQGEKPPMSNEVFALWEGEMQFIVNSATIYNTIEETGLVYSDFIEDISSYGDSFKPMVVKMTVKNIDAMPITDPPEFFSDGYCISSKDEFSQEKFNAYKDGDWRVASGMPLVYVEPHTDDSIKYFHYSMSPGEAIEMTLCYYVKIDDVPLDELMLEISTQSSDHRFGVKLDKLEEAK